MQPNAFPVPADTAVKEFLTPADLAALLDLSLGTIYVMNCEGTAPPRYKVGRQVLYRRAEVDQWLEGRRVQSSRSAT
jgi:excisionase family DNA binding protein